MAGNAERLERSESAESVALYRRVISASMERIWENVLDWEHLPWLHGDTFAAIELIAEDAEGWRALVTLAPEQGGGETEVEVRLDRENLCYTTRTVAGIGAGTDIVTSLTPLDFRTTRIEVDFRVPGLDDETAEQVGAYYRQLYARLWDQDQAMMGRRQDVLDERAAVRAQPSDSIADHAPVPLGDEASVVRRLPFLVEVAGRMFRLLDVGGEIVAHAAVCPHRGGPLEAVVVEDGCVTCPWHGYRFDVRTGKSADGRGIELAAPPRVEIDPTTRAVSLVWR